MENIKKILIISSNKTLLDVLHFCFDGWGYEVFLWENYEEDTTSIKRISPDVIVIDIHSAKTSDLKICHTLKNDHITAFTPMITLIDKRHLRSQLLNLKYGVDDYLIKPPDPLDLRIRIEMALRRSQYSFYVSPLTGIPGGRVIEETVNEKLRTKQLFSFGYVDIDNFKSFNDKYGYVKGDRVIMQVAYLLYTNLKKYGNPDDFTGHIGGDDFAFITTPDKYESVCHNLLAEFDRIAPFHYNDEDRKHGYTIARDRNKALKKMPLMSLSVAIINKNETSTMKTMLEINERVAEIKKYLKKITGSKFMADRRDQNAPAAFDPRLNAKGGAYDFSYKPLGQILLEKNIISGEQLDEALKNHWRKGIIFGEILKESGVIKEDQLRDALLTQTALLH